MNEHTNDFVAELGAMLEQTSSSACEIAASTEQTAKNMQTIRDEVNDLDQNMLANSSVVDEVSQDIKHKLSSVTHIKEAIIEQSKKAHDLKDLYWHVEEATKSVMNTLELIEDMTSQIKVICTNLKTQAFHIGKPAAGVHVIADEVKKYMLKTEDRSSEIKSILKNNAETIEQLAKANEDFGNNTISIANVLENTNNEIVEGLTGLDIMTSTIKEAQGKISTINNAIAEGVNAVQQNATAVLQIQEGTKEIRDAFYAKTRGEERKVS